MVSAKAVNTIRDDEIIPTVSQTDTIAIADVVNTFFFDTNSFRN